MNNYVIEENRIYLKENDKILAEINFEKIDDTTYNIYHTYVDEFLRKKGIASILVDKAISEIKKRNCNIVATCSYAKKYLENKKGDVNE